MYSGIHHTKRTAMKNEWRMLVLEALSGEEEMFAVPVHILVVAEYIGNKCDVDNLCTKLVIDGLKGRVICDDDPRYVAAVTSHVPPGTHSRNHVTVTITPYDSTE